MFGALLKSNMPARSKGTPSAWSALSSARSKDPGIPGRRQLYSTKLMIEVWSLRLWSTSFAFAYGEITSIGSLGPRPQRPCSPARAPPRPLPVPLAHSPEVPLPAPRTVFVRLSATECDGFVTPL